MKKHVFLSSQILPFYWWTILALTGALFVACEKEPVDQTDPPPSTQSDGDQVVEFAADELLALDLLLSTSAPTVGYLDEEGKVLYADMEKLEALREQFQPIKEAEGIWVIEKNGQPTEYKLLPLAELDPEKPVGEEDEITRENEYCKKMTQCFYGRTAKQWYRYTADSIIACVVRADEYCTGRYEKHEVELHSEGNCVTPEEDDNGNVIKKKIGIFVCTR